MKILDLTMPTVAENLALDEALLNQAIARGSDGEVFRLWESEQPAAIIGRASRVEEEVNRDYCRANQVAIRRRCSGGASVMIGPGCLMYAVVLSTVTRPQLLVVDQIHQYVLGHLRTALAKASIKVDVSGTSDLTVGAKKCSGNSLRCKREAVLYHGTLLYGASIAAIGQCLKMPPRQPDYREQRPHHHFLTNLSVARDDLHQALKKAWACDGPLTDWPAAETRELAKSKYSTDEWNLQR
ncbi:MAG: lipoate--protein ligase family protein [Planctomycetaceae bacterium]|nr:lipoate--protein ligase family protein [Planctomycetaceae bacterium]